MYLRFSCNEILLCKHPKRVPSKRRSWEKKTRCAGISFMIHVLCALPNDEFHRMKWAGTVYFTLENYSAYTITTARLLLVSSMFLHCIATSGLQTQENTTATHIRNMTSDAAHECICVYGEEKTRSR